MFAHPYSGSVSRYSDASTHYNTGRGCEASTAARHNRVRSDQIGGASFQAQKEVLTMTQSIFSALGSLVPGSARVSGDGSKSARSVSKTQNFSSKAENVTS